MRIDDTALTETITIPIDSVPLITASYAQGDRRDR